MPLRTLFVDMNAYFASVEQLDDPTLRGQPVAVVAVAAETTSVLAASYEAKAFGVKTGTPVWMARQMCPGLVICPSRQQRYVEVHEKIVRAVGRCIPVSKVMSVDEMACQLIGDERTPAKVTAIAAAIKREIRTTVGESLTCSIGAAPNGILAKVAADMMKPDGLTVIQTEELPTRMYPLELCDFPGIGPRMEKRLHLHNVFTVRQLYQLTAKQLSTVWGSVIHGERWFYQLRGEEVYEKPTRRQTLGHSHVLPPGLRTDSGCRGVLVRLIHKAAARLRSIDYWAQDFAVGLKFEDNTRWDAVTNLAYCQDTLTLMQAFAKLWECRPPHLARESAPGSRPGVRYGASPIQAYLNLSGLVPTRGATPSLFERERQATELGHAMDRANRAFGKQSVQFASLLGSEETAPTRIPFGAIPSFNPAMGG